MFLQTLPFFALIALGYGAAQRGFFGPEATAALTRFVFYFALSALIFRFAAQLSLDEIMDWALVKAALAASLSVYALVTAVAALRGVSLGEAAAEAQCAVIGNLGFLGIPLLIILLGEASVGPLLLLLSVDLLVFSNLFVILVMAGRQGRLSLQMLRMIGMGLVSNPMVVSIVLGLSWSATGWPLPGPFSSFLTTLGAAATPGALFAIGASLASKSAERLSVALWLAVAKLVLHPAAAVVAGTMLFAVDREALQVMVAAAALPVAGNIYILAQHFGVAPQRVSAAILVSTILSVVTVPIIVAWMAETF